MRTPKVAGIVLNYNGKDLTLQTLESLHAMSFPALDLFVVDNGSGDGSFAAVAEAFPDVEQVRVEENRGVANGLNVGVRYVIDRDYDYLLLLNNDIEVDPEMLSEMVAVAESDKTIGCVGPKAYYYWERQVIWSAGGRICFREAVTKERGMGEVDRGQYDQTEEVDYINGCAILVRRSVMAEVGLYDPLFYLAVEDADWCMRMKRRGYRSVYAHKAVLWHMVSASTGTYKPGRTFQTGRSTAIFVRRYGSVGRRIMFLLFLAAAIPWAFVRELPSGNQGAAVAKLKGVLEGLRVPLTSPPSIDDAWAARTGGSGG